MNGYVRVSRGFFHLEDYFDAVFHGKKIFVTDEVYNFLDDVRRRLESKIEKGEIIYGINTGLGALANKILKSEDLDQFQLNIIRSHSVGVGYFAPPEIARGALLLRIVSMSKGHSGIRSGLLKLLVEFFNSGAIPLIPFRGSVGASGDLSPLSHLTLAVIGDSKGAILYGGKTYKGEELVEVLRNEIYQNILEDPQVKPLLNKSEKSPLIKLSYKESLALNNGTSFSAAISLFVVYWLEKLFRIADANASLMLEALSGIRDAFDERFFEHGDPRYEHPGLSTVTTVKGILEEGTGSGLVKGKDDSFRVGDVADVRAEGKHIVLKFDSLKTLMMGIIGKLEVLVDLISSKLKCKKECGSKENNTYYLHCENVGVEDVRDLLIRFKEIGFVQDAYSLRCAPQIHGAARRALEFAKSVLLDEINLPNDNPLIFQTDDGGIEILSGGNFHGQSIALASENLALSIAYIANISERRIFRVLDPNLNNGLPAFLALNPGLESGLMLAQYTAAELLAEIRQLSNPPSVNSIPTSANQEDVVSMSATSSLRLLKMLTNLEYILSIEQLLALQGIALRLGWPLQNPDFKVASPLAQKLIDYYNEIFRELGGFPFKGDTVFSDYFELARRNIYNVQERFL